MAPGKFIANPGRMRQGGEMMEELPARVKKISENFISDMSNYYPWPGIDDDFALETRPKYDANNQACLDLLTAIGGAFTGLRHAVLSNSRHIEGVSSDARDEIDRQMSSLDTPDDSSQGGRH
ncbi:hypothetical protein [Streptomyces californicus]|uniref:hypothetical protein n=1 Tax=Streptomyces californicus TaxID=67351 RepID=UPI0004C0E413|nr:hypothetical protein [Streptomyces californicus]